MKALKIPVISFILTLILIESIYIGTGEKVDGWTCILIFYSLLNNYYVVTILKRLDK